jgi:ATP-dependent Clp protease ATP-binding subunit ClpA
MCPLPSQDFEKAGQLRDREMELKAQIAAISGAAKEGEAAEAEAGEGGPVVTEQDIANIVAQWTGIPVEKVRRCLESGTGYGLQMQRHLSTGCGCIGRS